MVIEVRGIPLTGPCYEYAVTAPAQYGSKTLTPKNSYGDSLENAVRLF
jgi:hypothetical protein